VIHQRSDDPDLQEGKILSSRVGFKVASEWEKSHQRSCELSRDLK